MIPLLAAVTLHWWMVPIPFLVFLSLAIIPTYLGIGREGPTMLCAKLAQFCLFGGIAVYLLWGCDWLAAHYRA